MLVVPFCFTTIFYWMTNLNNDFTRFMICNAIIVGVAQISAAYSEYLINFNFILIRNQKYYIKVNLYP